MPRGRNWVTGEQLAQVDNRDPFAAPVWRSPVYRTPEPVILVVQLIRLIWRVLWFALTHPGVDAVTALVETAKQTQGLGNGHLLSELRLLQLHADTLAQRPVVTFTPSLPEYLDRSFVRRCQSLQYPNRRGLPRPVWPKQPETFSFEHLEIEPINGRDIGESLHEPVAPQRNR